MKADLETINLQTEMASQKPISVIVGDLLCVHCSYNLTGQHIFREQHYDLLIARCPECGSVASLQDYPALGRWANRWAGVFAGLWILFLLAMWAGTSAAIFGISMGTAMEASDGPFQEYIDQQYTQWKDEQEALAANNPSMTPAATNAITPSNQTLLLPPGTPARIQAFVLGRYKYTNFNTWWNLQNKSALLTQMGGWRKALNKEIFLFWIPTTIIAFIFGCFWGIALLKQRWRGLLIWATLLIATSSAFAVFAFVDWSYSTASDPWQASEHIIAPLVLAITLAYAAIPLFTGVLLGRPIARQLTRILLPPRLLNSLSTLWITDGLKPPNI